MARRLEKRPRPSYEDGKLRDPSIEDKQTKPTSRKTVLRLIRKAIGKEGR